MSQQRRSRPGIDLLTALAMPRDESGVRAIHLAPQNAASASATATSKPSEGKQPTLTRHAPGHDHLRRRAIIGGLSALVIVLTCWLIPVVGFILTILALLVLHGIVAPEPIDTYFDEQFDPHRHSRW